MIVPPPETVQVYPVIPDRVEYTTPVEPTQTLALPVITGMGDGNTVKVKSRGELVQPFRLDMIW